jgi:hypothetical protein
VYMALLILLFLLHVCSLVHGQLARGRQVLLTHCMGFKDIALNLSLIVYSFMNKPSALGIWTDSVGPQRSQCKLFFIR